MIHIDFYYKLMNYFNHLTVYRKGTLPSLSSILNLRIPTTLSLSRNPPSNPISHFFPDTASSQVPYSSIAIYSTHVLFALPHLSIPSCLFSF